MTVRRGVVVTLLVTGNSMTVRPASHSCDRALLLACIRVHESRHTPMHSKEMVVDGDWSLVDSQNFDSCSPDFNYGNAFAARDPVPAAWLAESFSEDLRDSPAITMEVVDDSSTTECARNAWSLPLHGQLLRRHALRITREVTPCAGVRPGSTRRSAVAS